MSRRTKTVVGDAHVHATLHCALERRHDAATGFVIGEDVGFKAHFFRGGINGLLQRRKILGTTSEQLHLIAGVIFVHVRSKCAASGA